MSVPPDTTPAGTHRNPARRREGMRGHDPISDNARLIASALGLRGMQQRLPGTILDQVHRILKRAASDPQETVYRDLERVLHNINDRRALTMFLVLLDKLWLVRSGSVAETDVVRMMREQHMLLSGQDQFKQLLQEELLRKQWSSFQSVRRTVCRVREVEAVAQEEAEALADPRASSEVRVFIARRILLHRQHQYLNQLLDYIVRSVLSPHTDAAERKEVDQLLKQLREFDPMELLPPLYMRYRDHFDEQNVRGFLMRTLSSMGEWLVPQLVELYTRNESGRDRKPVVRLLRQMIGFGLPEAARALCQITLTAQAQSPEFAYAADQLLQGGQEQAMRGVENEKTAKIRDYIDDAARQLSDSRAKTRQDYGSKLSTLPWDSEITAELVERAVNMTAAPEERQRLRLGGRKATSLLLGVIMSKERSTRQRTEAVKSLATVFGIRNKPDLAGELWDLYRNETDVDLRMAALDCMGDNSLQPPVDDARRILYEDFQKADRSARESINRNFALLFPDAPAPGALNAQHS